MIRVGPGTLSVTRVVEDCKSSFANEQKSTIELARGLHDLKQRFVRQALGRGLASIIRHQLS